MKILEINGTKSVRVKDSFGDKDLYPNDTIRTVKRFNLLKGWVITKEKSEIKFDIGSDGVVYHNKWITILDSAVEDELRKKKIAKLQEKWKQKTS